MNRKKTRLLRIVLPLLLAALGCVGGYVYYRYVGCASGSCALRSSPYLSVAFGGVIGALLGYAAAPAGRGGRENTDKPPEP